MNRLRYTLVTDGPSDVAFLPILTWLLRDEGVETPIDPQWADLRKLPQKSSPKKLKDKITKACYLYPCDVLFIHRDAERETINKRAHEIYDAVREIKDFAVPPCLCVIPVKMMEAWLLIEEQAIRRAAGNPNGQTRLQMPSINSLESLTDPKNKLYELLKKASGRSEKSRRLAQFNTRQAAATVPHSIENFSTLDNLPAFQKLRKDVSLILKLHNLNRQ